MEHEYEVALSESCRECFVSSLSLGGSMVSEVFTDTEPVCRAARARGHRVGPSRTLHSGNDFTLKEARERLY